MFTEKDFFDFPLNNDLSRIVVPIKIKPSLPSSKRDKRLSDKKLTLLRKQQRSLKQSAS